MRSDANNILKEVSFEHEKEEAQRNIGEFEKNRSILDENNTAFGVLSRPLNPGVITFNSTSSNPSGNTPITKEQKIEIVNRSLDEDTLGNMQDGDKIKYFDNNTGSLLTAIKEVLR